MYCANSQLPLNDYTALVSALVLVINAPTDAQAAKAMSLADDLAASLTPAAIEQAKAQALMILNQEA